MEFSTLGDLKRVLRGGLDFVLPCVEDSYVRVFDDETPLSLLRKVALVESVSPSPWRSFRYQIYDRPLEVFHTSCSLVGGVKYYEIIQRNGAEESSGGLSPSPPDLWLRVRGTDRGAQMSELIKETAVRYFRACESMSDEEQVAYAIWFATGFV